MNSKKKEKLEAAIKKKKECNMKAMSIVERWIDIQLDEETFLTNLQHINQCHFQDIVDERSITKLCGYPLCDVALSQVVNKRYHISTTVNKVYDITQRKKFCSNYCYKASIYIKEQMLTSPLWLRHSQVIPNFKLLRRHSCTNDRGEEVVMWDQGVTTEMKNEANHHSNKINKIDKEESDIKLNCKMSLGHSVCENEDNSRKIIEDKNEHGDCKKEVRVNDNNRNNEKKILKNNGITKNGTKRALEECLKEWITVDTLNYLMGKEHVVNVFKERDIRPNDDGNSIMVEKYNKLCEKINKLEIQEEMLSLNHKEELEERKALPDYETLKKEASRMQLKVKEFLNAGKKVTFDENIVISKNGEEEEPVLPLLDQHSQNVIRRKIMSDKLKIPLSNVSVMLRLDARDIIKEANKLLSTFSLSSHNIMFRHAECILISIILIKMLSIKDKSIANCFEDSALRELFKCNNNIENARDIDKYSCSSFLFDLICNKQ